MPPTNKSMLVQCIEQCSNNVTDAVQVGVRVLRHVVVEDDVDTLYVHATTKQVGGHQDALLEVLELLVTVQPAH